MVKAIRRNVFMFESPVSHVAALDVVKYSTLERLVPAILSNVQFKPLEIINEKAIAGAGPGKWFNQTLSKVRGSVVRKALIEADIAGT